MKSNYNYIITEILKSEGGYSNHPSDKGGPTNYGITIANYRKYIKPRATAKDVENMNIEDAKKIYKEIYWNKVNGDSLPSGVDYTVMDYGVHSGYGRANQIYNKFKDLKDPVKIINAICDERLAFMKRIRGGVDWKVFGRGWNDRLNRVRKGSLTLANNNQAMKNTTATVAGTAAAAGAVLNYEFLLQNWPFALAGVLALGFIIYKLVRK